MATLNFYLPGLSTITAPALLAEFYPLIETKNPDVLDYSANAICRMKKSVAQNMFQFWAKNVDISKNSLSSLAFRLWHDASSGAVSDGQEANARPMSLDFVNGAIVTWVDPSSEINYITPAGGTVKTRTLKWFDSSTNATYQSLLPHDYLRYLSAKIFVDGNGNMNPDSENVLDNSQAVMNSVDLESRKAFETKLDSLSASRNASLQYDYRHYLVTGTTTLTPDTTSIPVSAVNPSGLIFQQIRNKKVDRINTYDSTSGRVAAQGDGFWYRMPFIEGDSIYFTLGITDPSGQGLGSGSGNIIPEVRKYRIRMYILDDTTIDGMTGPQDYNYTFGSLTALSPIQNGYSWTGNFDNVLGRQDDKPPGVV